MANEMTGIPNPVNLARSELVLSGALLGLLVLFLIPLPPRVLDVLLAFNLSATILLLLVTLGVRQALEFSVFPSLLLLLTLMRLGLNVATTRLILLQGNAGDVVAAFGQFVVGGNLVVGLVIFLILVVIQFIVITRGASRVSEVAARFTLDAMPGKQMAIDADLNAGVIDEKQARTRRSDLMRESEFYGTMDGASKFVRGDAVASLIITAINLVGGIIIGVINGQSIAVAIRTYSILTIGDGLITQIPALVIATASGILVTKSSSDSNLGQEISQQLGMSSTSMRNASFIIMGLGVVPGMPTIPFLLLGAGMFFLARRIFRTKQDKEKETKLQEQSDKEVLPPVKSPTEAYLDDFLQVDRIAVDLGARLISLVDSRGGSGLIDKIGFMRREIARQSGLWVPMVRMKDNIGIDPESYRILIGGREVARGELRVGLLLAVDPGMATFTIEGEPTREPAYNLPAVWIAPTDRQRAELGGYNVVDPRDVLINHLAEVIRRHASELLSREDMKTLIDKVKESSPAVVEELIPGLLPMATVHRVITILLEERVPVTNMTRILESLASNGALVKDAAELAERVRLDIGRAICDRFRDENGVLRAICLDPMVEMEFRAAYRERTQPPDPNRLNGLINKVELEKVKANAQGREICLVVDLGMRRIFRTLLTKPITDLSVLSHQEIPNDVPLKVDSIVGLQDLAAR
ncbi:flagellar biosynthesis protein FlhA [Zavarzinella formosa]|uniref:flagellar biosynthesis protein FlhA n=1 Tax=Zavarzinella formosa TaxID=360055 RepID=UPI00031FB9ED|nr:flagellar biosynthesis protein FlhA [Zavarzinella formosa]